MTSFFSNNIIDRQPHSSSMTEKKQNCIPVGCIPPAHWPYLTVCSAPRGGGGGGACLVPGVCAWSGRCLIWWGACLVLGGAWSGGCLVPGDGWSGGCLVRWATCLVLGGACLFLGGAWSEGPACLVPGVPAWSQGGACLVQGGWYPSMHWGRPPVNRILDTRFWKYYLAPNFVCGR